MDLIANMLAGIRQEMAADCETQAQRANKMASMRQEMALRANKQAQLV